MKMLLVAISLAGILVAPAALAAAEKKKVGDAAHIVKAIADHRAMAEAHLNAAKCLEAGRPEKECHAQLAKDCKGLAIGKFCGMQHRH